MLFSTGFWAPGKDLVMSFMTKAYWAAMGSLVSFEYGDLTRELGDADADFQPSRGRPSLRRRRTGNRGTGRAGEAWTACRLRYAEAHPRTRSRPASTRTRHAVSGDRGFRLR